MWRELSDGILDVGSVSTQPVVLLRRVDTDEIHTAEVPGVFGRIREPEPPVVDVLPEQSVEFWLVEGSPSLWRTASFSGSTSTARTSYPSSAMQAAWVVPR